MNVRDLTLVLRPRSDWEAVDLGTALARRYYRDLFRMGWLAFAPAFLVLAILCWPVPYLLPFLIWWFKPIYDRFYLFYLSRRIFGQEVTVKETLGKWKSLVFKNFFSLLIVRRFLPSRSQTLAVSELENLSGADRSQRCSVITRVGGGQAFLVTLGGLFLEALGVLSVIVLATWLTPQGVDLSWDAMVIWFERGGLGPKLLVLGASLGYGMLILLLEPIYLGSGFGLYLNSRTRQEAWDIELQFRELSARVAKTQVVSSGASETLEEERQAPPQEDKPKFKFAGSKPVVLLALFCGLLSAVISSDLRAEDPQVVVEEVLADDAFEVHVEKYRQRVSKNRDDSDYNGPDISPPMAGIEGLFMLVGYLALALLVGALVVLMVNLLGGSPLKAGVAEKKFKRPPPKVVMGMEVTPESLPDDILRQARHYWSQGQPKLALSLLYRGALTKLIIEKEVVIEGSDTESECLANVELGVPGPLANYFRTLTANWMKAAYSHEEVVNEEFERLCVAWPFERRAK